MRPQDFQIWDGVTNHRNCIYAYVNKRNGKVYVGQTEQFKIRHRKHCQIGENKAPIDKALNKYGEDEFFVFIIEDNLPDHDAMNEREIFYIAEFESFKKGYNQTLGGGGLLGRPGYWKGKKIPPHVAALLDRTGKEPWNKGKKCPQLSEAQKGKIISEEQRGKISKTLMGHKTWNKGVPMTDEQKEKDRLAHLGKISKKRIAVLKIDMNGNILARYDYVVAANNAEHTHIKLGKYNARNKCYYIRENDYEMFLANEIALAQSHETRLDAAEREIVELKRENAELKARLNN